MNFDDLKDDLREQLANLWDKIQESSIYITLRERYEDFSPRGQKLTIAGVVSFILMILLSYPIESLINSSAHMEEFETKRALVGRMHNATRQLNMGPNIPVPPEPAALESQVRQRLNNAALLPEQVTSVNRGNASGKIIPNDLVGSAITVRLSKLNLQQIVDLGREFEGIHPSVKLKDLSIQAGDNDEGYFNVIYEIVPLAVPSTAVAAAEPDAEAPANGRNPRTRNR